MSGLLGFGLSGLFLLALLGMQHFHLRSLAETLFLDSLTLTLLRVELLEQRLVLPVVLGLLLLKAKMFDVLVAVLEVTLHLPLLGLEALQRVVRVV